jgi:exosome complex RNA-binding protein Csl4
MTVFTCLRCEQNYTVDGEMKHCPVCDWKRARDVTKPKPYSRD